MAACDWLPFAFFQFLQIAEIRILWPLTRRVARAGALLGLPVPAKRDERCSGHGGGLAGTGQTLERHWRDTRETLAQEAEGRARAILLLLLLLLSMDGVCALALYPSTPYYYSSSSSSRQSTLLPSKPLRARSAVFCLMGDRASELQKGHRRLRRRAVHSARESCRCNSVFDVARRPGLRLDYVCGGMPLALLAAIRKSKSAVETFPHDAATEFRRIVVRKPASTL